MNNVFIQLMVLKIIVQSQMVSLSTKLYTNSLTYIYIFFRQILKLIISKHPWPDILEVHNEHKEHKTKTHSIPFFLIQSSGGLLLTSTVTSTTLHD